jgi:hypothetical protein
MTNPASTKYQWDAGFLKNITIDKHLMKELFFIHTYILTYFNAVSCGGNMHCGICVAAP